MTNLLPNVAFELSERVRLFNEFSVLSFPPCTEGSVRTDSVIKYHADCADILNKELTKIQHQITGIDKNDSESIPIAFEKNNRTTFVMEPVDVSTHLENGLAYDYDNEHAVFTDDLVFDTGELIVDGDNISIILTKKLYGQNGVPFDYVDITNTFNFAYQTISTYQGTTATTALEFKTLLRGPEDNIDDRGINYLDPVDLTVSSSFSSFDSSYKITKIGSIWSCPVASLLVGYDDVLSGSMEHDMLFSIEQGGAKILSGDTITLNDTTVNFNNVVHIPASHWSAFTKTQSPNILTEINNIRSSDSDLNSTLYSNVIQDELADAYDVVIDAVRNGELLNKQNILTQVRLYLITNKVKAKDNTAILYELAKTILAESTLYESLRVSLDLLDIAIDIPTVATPSFLSELNIALINISITDFEISVGLYDYSKITNCLSLDEAARFSAGVLNQILSINDVLENPCITRIRNDFNFIESDIFETRDALTAVI